jgi:hypothetical protein
VAFFVFKPLKNFFTVLCVDGLRGQTFAIRAEIIRTILVRLDLAAMATKNPAWEQAGGGFG